MTGETVGGHFTAHGSLYPFQAADTGLWSWVIADPLVWEIRNPAGIVTGEIVVPAYFTTDLGTIPWLVRWLFNPADPQCAKAYVLHDWLLSLWGSERQLEAAGVMHQALRALGVSGWRRNSQVLAVIAAIDNW